MSNSTTFLCDTCYDTEVIDQGGSEIECPDCPLVRPITVKLTGISLYLGDCDYSTLAKRTATTMTFEGTQGAILRDASHNVRAAKGRAKLLGLTGRNNVSSPAIALEKRLRAQLLGK